MWGASCVKKNELNKTPLHLAVERGNVEAAELLMKYHYYRPTDLNVS